MEAIDHYVRRCHKQMGLAYAQELPFARFTTWIRGKKEFQDLVHRLRHHNDNLPMEKSTGVSGLDLDNMSTSKKASID